MSDSHSRRLCRHPSRGLMPAFSTAWAMRFAPSADGIPHACPLYNHQCTSCRFCVVRTDCIGVPRSYAARLHAVALRASSGYGGRLPWRSRCAEQTQQSRDVGEVEVPKRRRQTRFVSCRLLTHLSDTAALGSAVHSPPKRKCHVEMGFSLPSWHNATLLVLCCHLFIGPSPVLCGSGRRTLPSRYAVVARLLAPVTALGFELSKWFDICYRCAKLYSFSTRPCCVPAACRDHILNQPPTPSQNPPNRAAAYSHCFPFGQLPFSCRCLFNRSSDLSLPFSSPVRAHLLVSLLRSRRLVSSRMLTMV